MKKYLFCFVVAFLIGTFLFMGCDKDNDSFIVDEPTIELTASYQVTDSLKYMSSTFSEELLSDLSLTVSEVAASTGLAVKSNPNLNPEDIEVQSYKSAGNVSVIAMMINLGENFLYTSGQSMLKLVLVDNESNENLRDLTLVEAAFLQFADDLNNTHFTQLTQVSGPGDGCGFWTIQSLPAQSMTINPFVYLAPNVDTLSSLGLTSAFIQRHKFSVDSDCTDNVREPVVSVSP